MKVVLQLQRERILVCQTGYFGDRGTIRFDNSEVGIEGFRQYLRQHREVGFIVLLDPGDEQFYWQQIPRMKRRDQQAILSNQRKKLFGDSAFVSSIVDDQISSADTRLSVAHTGLAADAKACVWLAELERADSYVRSFHWMSLLIYAGVNTCVKRTVESPSNAKAGTGVLTIVIVRIDTNDDRVMAFRGSLPLICRHVSHRTPGAGDQSLNEQALVYHLQQTISYLANMDDSAASGFATTVVVAGHFTSVEINAIQVYCGEAADMDVTVVPASSLVKNLSKNKTASGCVAELLVRSVVRRRAFVYSFISSGARYLQRTVRHVLYAASVSFLFGAVAVSAASRHVGNEIHSLVLLATDIEEQSAQLRDNNEHPEWSIQYPVDAVRESVGYIKGVEAAAIEVAPLHFLVSVSEQLTQYPKIDLLSVSWNRDDNKLFGNSDTLKNHQRKQTPDAQSTPVGADEFNAIVTGIVHMDGRGEASAMNRFRAFVGSIRETAITTASGSSVTVISLPFTEGGSTARSSGRGSGEFRLEITSRRAGK